MSDSRSDRRHRFGPSRTDSRDLHAEIVEYPDSPDRVTVYPPGLTGVDRMSTWLSADRSLLVDLDERR